MIIQDIHLRGCANTKGDMPQFAEVGQKEAKEKMK